MHRPFFAYLTGWRAAVLGCLLATLSGALVTLSLAPFDYWPIGIVSTSMIAYIMATATPQQAAIRGWFYGLGLFGAGTSWVYVSIHIYGNAPVPLAVFLTAFFCAGLGLFTCFTFYLYARLVRDNTLGHTVGFACIFVLGEWLRSWFLTGFPWMYLGYGHLQTVLGGWAPIGGVLSISFIVALTAGYLSYCIRQQRIAHRQLLLVAALWTGGWAIADYPWVKPAAQKPIEIAMVQADISQAIKWNRDQYWPTLNLYNTLSEPLWQHADIVVWPEAAIPGYYHNATNFLNNMESKARQRPSTLITGIPYRNVSDDGQTITIHNSVVALGNGSGVYHKQRLVPFGEYVPLEQWLRGLIDFFNLPMSSFTPGSSDQAGLNAANITLAPFICYEIVYPDLVASWLPHADVLITISNDAWFGRSIGPLQHLQMAQMRALENGRYLIRATGSGVSAIIDPQGNIVNRSEQFKRQVLTGQIQTVEGNTPFSRFASWPVVILCFSLCIASLLHNRFRG